MTWTPEQLEQIPEVYRDFMVVLKPVLDSKAPGRVLRINGIPFGMVYEALSNRYDYDIEQVRQLAHNLCREGWIEEDNLGFFTPTAKGEDLIRALSGSEDGVRKTVPPLPAF
ncbi:MAG TPA: hypothetical protein VMF69_27250 [Gemmataceae bacterium]|nr:hypothetical protein [Gemmataceae bacterium]